MDKLQLIYYECRRGLLACCASSNAGTYRLARHTTIIRWKGAGPLPSWYFLKVRERGCIITMYTYVISPLYLPCLTGEGRESLTTRPPVCQMIFSTGLSSFVYKYECNTCAIPFVLVHLSAVQMYSFLYDHLVGCNVVLVRPSNQPGFNTHRLWDRLIDRNGQDKYVTPCLYIGEYSIALFSTPLYRQEFKTSIMYAYFTRKALNHHTFIGNIVRIHIMML
mgnify:CR=1 FL=1